MTTTQPTTQTTTQPKPPAYTNDDYITPIGYNGDDDRVRLTPENYATARRLVQFLRLFDNADAVARYFENNRITGIPCNEDSCPVANALWVFKGVREVATGTYSTHVIFADQQRVCIKHPDGIQAFIQSFDAHRYPALIDYNYEANTTWDEDF